MTEVIATEANKRNLTNCFDHIDATSTESPKRHKTASQNELTLGQAAIGARVQPAKQSGRRPPNG